ncbi:MAG: IS5 family transposase [Chloroflexota bacterium]
MAKQLVTDQLWAVIEPLLPPTPPRPKGGRPPIPNRAALTGILFVLKTGIQWEWLPQEMGCGSGMTCWRRLRDWQRAGVWQRLQEELLRRLRRADRIDFSRASLDSAMVRAKGGGQQTGKNPTDRGKPGSKHHVLVDRSGLPLVVGLTGANVSDPTTLAWMVDAVPPLHGARGRPRQRPGKLHADKAYDSAANRAALRRRHILPRLARKGREAKERLGRSRWVAERTIAWLHQFRRLAVRYERRADIHEAFLRLAAALLCFHYLE